MTLESPDIAPQDIAQKIDGLCKPPGSLGALEALAHELCRIQKTLQPQTRPCHVSIFAADHGVTSEGVTAWPSEVTGAVVSMMQRQRTASGVFAKTLQCTYEVVDVGLIHEIKDPTPTLISAASRRGTANLRVEAAMDDEDFEHAWNVGQQRAERACQQGAIVLIGGEMGIGNTTSATCLTAWLCDATSDFSELVGRGAGADDDQLSRKRTVIEQSLRRVQQLGVDDPRSLAGEVGGLEIVALAGFYAEAAANGRTVLVDGLIATSAALLADAICPGTRDQMIAGHRSTEPAHTVALEKLGLTPTLDLSMGLGEGTGALAALPLLDLAAAAVRDMATLEELTGNEQ